MAVLGVPKYPNSPTLIVPSGKVVGVIYNIGSVPVQLSENINGLNSPTAVVAGAFTDGFPLQPGDSFSILLGWDLALYASSLDAGALLTVILSYPCGALLSGRSQPSAEDNRFSNPQPSGVGTPTPTTRIGESAPLVGSAPLPVAPAPAPSSGETSTTSTTASAPLPVSPTPSGGATRTISTF